MPREESLNLSFLTPIRASLEPTVFDLDAYFPGKLFWKCALIEPYTLDTRQIEELRSKGWQSLDHRGQANVILRLTSQLSMVLGITTTDKKEPTLWARTEDIRYAENCPVVLVYESTQNPSVKQLQQMIPGTHAIIFQREAVYRYTLEQLGEVGFLFWHQIFGGLQSATLHFSTATPDGQMINPLYNEERYRTFIESYNVRLAQANRAAHDLARCYWQQHQHHPNEPVRMLQAVTEIPQAFRQRIFVKDGSLIPATDALEAALLAMSNATEGARGWTEQENKPVYLHQKPNSTTAVTVRANTALPDSAEDITKQLWRQVSSFSDLDGDVLLAMIAQVVAIGQDERGGTWITAQDILTHRGIVPKKHHTREPGKLREAGHRPDDMRDIAECVERIRDTHVTVRTWREPRKPGGRRRIVKLESYLVLISDFLLQTREGETAEGDPLQIAWYYRPGTCLEALPLGRRAQAALLLQKALRYDPYRQKWEKRLARYFMFNLRINNVFGGTTIRRSIGMILNEISLSSISKTDPEKTKARFERAMRTLEREGHISDWGEEQYLEAMKQRPARGWVDSWLSYEMEITAAPLLEELTEDMLDQFKGQHWLSSSDSS